MSKYLSQVPDGCSITFLNVILLFHYNFLNVFMLYRAYLLHVYTRNIFHDCFKHSNIDTMQSTGKLLTQLADP